MVAFILLLACVGGSIILHFEDKNRRSGACKLPVWTKLIFKFWAAGTAALLATIFFIEDGEWLVDLVRGSSAEELNARIVAAIVTLGSAALYFVLTYLGSIPDDDEDMNIIADAVYYDGDDDDDPNT